MACGLGIRPVLTRTSKGQPELTFTMCAGTPAMASTAPLPAGSGRRWFSVLPACAWRTKVHGWNLTFPMAGSEFSFHFVFRGVKYQAVATPTGGEIQVVA